MYAFDEEQIPFEELPGEEMELAAIAVRGIPELSALQIELI